MVDLLRLGYGLTAEEVEMLRCSEDELQTQRDYESGRDHMQAVDSSCDEMHANVRNNREIEGSEGWRHCVQRDCAHLAHS